jgi:AGCS family alanine or glycine:cation symporter
MTCVFDILSQIDAFFWNYFGFTIIALLGCYLTIKTKFFQLRAIPSIIRTFFHFFKTRGHATIGTHPLKVFFASVGGMIGVGNIVGIITALQIGGPGAIFWVWVAAFLGSLIKYAEVFLGLKYRQKNSEGGYDGGSIYFLQKAFRFKYIGLLVSILLCIYGAEIYQFSVLTHSLSLNWGLNQTFVILTVLTLILYTVIGGIKRVGKICVWLVPLFTFVYISMSLVVIGLHITALPGLLKGIFFSAFTGHAAVGGFAGSTIMLAMQHGISRSVYSADVGIGYDSIIQSESSATQIENQARLSLLGVFMDNLICTLSLLVALTTGFWKNDPMLDPFLIVQNGLGTVFPGQVVFMPIFLFVLVFTTLISFLLVGMKCARFIHPRYGQKCYLVFATSFFLFFSYLDPSKALLIMSLAGCLLLCINLLGILILRKEVLFSLFSKELRDQQI